MLRRPRLASVADATRGHRARVATPGMVLAQPPVGRGAAIAIMSGGSIHNCGVCRSEVARATSDEGDNGVTIHPMYRPHYRVA